MLNEDTNFHTDSQCMCMHTLHILEAPVFKRLEQVLAALFQISFSRGSLGSKYFDMEVANTMSKKKHFDPLSTFLMYKDGLVMHTSKLRKK